MCHLFGESVGENGTHGTVQHAKLVIHITVMILEERFIVLKERAPTVLHSAYTRGTTIFYISSNFNRPFDNY